MPLSLKASPPLLIERASDGPALLVLPGGVTPRVCNVVEVAEYGKRHDPDAEPARLIHRKRRGSSSGFI